MDHKKMVSPQKCHKAVVGTCDMLETGEKML